MAPGREVEEAVRELLRTWAPVGTGGSQPTAELALGASGLGLDSIALVELLLECERRFDMPDPAELLAGPPLTVGGLVASVRGLRRG